jgi:hypothetical protein
MNLNEEEIIKRLQIYCSFDYGQIITQNILQEVLNVILSESDGIISVGPILYIKEIIEKKGFICVRDGLNLKILSLEDMRIKAERNIKNSRNLLRRNSNSMSKADISALNENEKARHLNSLNKIVMTMNAMSSNLRTI